MAGALDRVEAEVGRDWTRVLVVREGRIAGEVSGEDMTEDRIIYLASVGGRRDSSGLCHGQPDVVVPFPNHVTGVDSDPHRELDPESLPDAVGELCPGSNMPLSFGELSEARLTCPWHNEVYDVRSGQCLDPSCANHLPLPNHLHGLAGGIASPHLVDYVLNAITSLGNASPLDFVACI